MPTDTAPDIDTPGQTGPGVLHPANDEAGAFERRAVEQAFRTRAGRPPMPDELNAHLAVMRHVVSSPAARALAPPGVARYMLVAGRLKNALTHVGRADVGELANAAGPLVSLANRVLSKQGKAQAFGEGKAEPTPPHVLAAVEDAKRGPAYEVVPPHEVNVPEQYPDPKKRQLPPLRLISDDELARMKTRDAASKAAPVYAKGGIPVASSARPIGDPPLTESRYDAIARLSNAGHGRETILRHLTDHHLITRSMAAATYRRYLRAEHARRTASPVPRPTPPPGPERLARPTAAERNAAGFASAAQATGDQYRRPAPGRAFEPTQTHNTGVVTGSVDPKIAGTALAVHLQSIARQFHESSPQLAAAARMALRHPDAGPQSIGGLDPYTVVGRMLPTSHPLKTAYNWKNVEEKLRRDHVIKAWVERTVGRLPGMSDREYWDKVVRQFGGTQEHTNDTARKNITRFWQMAHDQFRGAGGVMLHADSAGFGDQFRESMHRIADRELDREYLKAVSKERTAQARDPEGRIPQPTMPAHGLGKMDHTQKQYSTGNASHEAGGPLDWRAVANRVPQGPHRFSRREAAGLVLLLSRSNPALRERIERTPGAVKALQAAAAEVHES